MAVNPNICNELDENEILLKAQEDVEYFSCLYERFEDRLLRYIRRLALTCSEEAEDILQEAFIKVWRNLNDFDPDLKLSSWLYRIVHNETISHCRKSKSFGKDKKVDLNEYQLDLIPDETETESNSADHFTLTHEVLRKMPVKYREILVLKYLEKMSYAEISDILKIPEGTVAVRINRAKKSFMKIADNKHISFNL